MIKIFYCLIFLAISDAAQGLEHYTFSASANGWLKLHAVPAKWIDAVTTCNAEGAVLASPLNENIVENLRLQMLLRKVDRPIHLGVNALRSKGYFVSLEGVNLDDMPAIWGSYGDGKDTGDCLAFTSDGTVSTSSCLAYLPYICYKKKEKNEVMNECGTFDDQYKLNATTGSCYKLHKEEKKWSEAQQICLAEAGHLVVLKNRDEAHFILDLVAAAQVYYSASSRLPLAHVGLLYWDNDNTLVTVTGERIDGVYNEFELALWESPMYKKGQLCVCLSSYGSLDYTFCDYGRLMFVCEKNPNTIQFERVAS